MGFWQGLNEGLTYAMDEKSRRKEQDALRQERMDERADAKSERALDRQIQREQFLAGQLGNRQEFYLKQLASQKEADDALKSQVGAAVGLGLTEVTAVALQNSGQLGLFLDQYDKNKKVDSDFVKDLNLAVVEYLGEAGDEAISQAMLNGVSTERDVKDPDESYLALTEAILNATTSEQMDEISKTLYKPKTRTALPAFNFNFGTASGLEPADTKAIRNEIAGALQPQFTDSFGVDTNGNVFVTQNADRDVANLFALAEERARNMVTGPTSQYNATNAAALVAKNIRMAVTDGNLSAKDIYSNFDSVMTGNYAVSAETPTTLAFPTATPPTTPQAQLGTMGDELSEDFFDTTLNQAFGGTPR